MRNWKSLSNGWISVRISYFWGLEFLFNAPTKTDDSTEMMVPISYFWSRQSFFNDPTKTDDSTDMNLPISFFWSLVDAGLECFAQLWLSQSESVRLFNDIMWVWTNWMSSFLSTERICSISDERNFKMWWFLWSFIFGHAVVWRISVIFVTSFAMTETGDPRLQPLDMHEDLKCTPTHPTSFPRLEIRHIWLCKATPSTDQRLDTSFNLQLVSLIAWRPEKSSISSSPFSFWTQEPIDSFSKNGRSQTFSQSTSRRRAFLKFMQ
jgi:hypothetical protein